MPEPRQRKIGGDVIEFEAVARRDEPLPGHHREHDDRKQERERASAQARARRQIVDRVDQDILVAQKHAGQREEERAGEQQLDQLDRRRGSVDC